MPSKKKYKSFYPSARVHHLTIFMSDKEGHVFMSREKLQNIIREHEGGYSSFAYILHDSDTYDAEAVYAYAEKNRITYLEKLKALSYAAELPEDETTESGFVKNEALERKAKEYADAQFPLIEKGATKPPHWHIILTFNTNRKVDEIARWFKVEPNWNEAKTGRGAAESAWSYLVHAHDENKFQYSPDSVTASFDYKVDLEKRLAIEEQHERYNIDTATLNDVLEEVSRGLSMEEVKKRVSRAVYYRNKRLFDEARKDYVLHYAPMPLYREVFYVESRGIDEDHGKGGIGKSAFSKAFAKHLAKGFGADIAKDINDLTEYIYIAGDAKVFLQEYDAQPVLLIDEISAEDMKRAMKGVNGVKALLAPFPERKSVDKKHGQVVCTAQYVIINGIQSYKAFVEDLAKSMKVDGVEQKSEESVKEQFERRFWGRIRIINADEIEFWINRGLFENTPEQTIMEMVGRVRANFRKLASGTGGHAQLDREQKILRPMLEAIERSKETHAVSNKITDPDQLTMEYLEMGEIVSTIPIEEEERLKYEAEQKAIAEKRMKEKADFDRKMWEQIQMQNAGDEDAIPF